MQLAAAAAEEGEQHTSCVICSCWLQRTRAGACKEEEDDDDDDDDDDEEEEEEEEEASILFFLSIFSSLNSFAIVQ